MKPWSAAILSLLRSETQYIFAHLYQITLADGANDYFTDFDMDITYNGAVYKSNSLRIENVHFKLETGVSVDEQNVRILALPSDTLAGVPFLAGAAQGLLDGAWMLRSRIFWPVNTGSAWLDVVSPAQFWPQVGQISYMRASTITKLGRSHVEMKWKSPLVLLDQQLPHNYYQPGCLWTLYQVADTDGFGCTMLKQNFGVAYRVGSNPTPLLIPANLSPSYLYKGHTYPGDPGGGNGVGANFTNGVLGIGGPNSNDGNPTFMLGRLLFASGLLANTQVSIATHDRTNFTLSRPLTTLPSTGDTFIAYAGCLKTVSACGLKFGTGAAGGAYTAVTGQAYSGNLPNFRGFDQVPSEHIGI